MYFKYNDITIGNDADTKVIAGAGRAFEMVNSVQWNTKTVRFNFFVKKTTEALYRAYVVSLEHPSTGIICLAKTLEVVFDDGSKWTYDPDPASTNPTGLMQTPQLDYVSGSPRNTSTSGEFTFTVVMELPNTVNGVKIVQANSIKDRRGLSSVSITGIVPKQYVAGKNDALTAFKAYFTSNVENAILNTFLGKDFYKLIELTFSNDKGLGSISDPGGSRWSTLYFTASYRQVAWKEDSQNIVSDVLVNPSYKFRPNPIPVSNQKLKSPQGSYSAEDEDDGDGDGGGEDALVNQVSVSFGSEINIYSSVFGKSKANMKDPKQKGHTYSLAELLPVYYDYIRPWLITQVSEAFGISTSVISDEVFDIDLNGVLSGGFNVINADSIESKFIKSTVITYEETGAEYVKAIAGKDYEGVKTIVPKQYFARVVNSYMTAQKEIKDERDPTKDEGWCLINKGIATSVQGFLFKSSADKKISIFNPAYLHSFTYNLVYMSSDSVTQNLVEGA